MNLQVFRHFTFDFESGPSLYWFVEYFNVADQRQLGFLPVVTCVGVLFGEINFQNCTIVGDL